MAPLPVTSDETGAATKSPVVTADTKTAGPAVLTGAEQSDEWVIFPECKGDDLSSYAPIGCHTHLHGPELSKEVLPHATLSEILKSIPADASASNTQMAVAELLFTLSLCAVSVYAVFRLPWIFLPFAWALAGFGMSHLYIIGHDCAHGTWVSSARVNRLIGEICFLPLLRSFGAFAREHAHGSKDSFQTFAAPKSATATGAAGSVTQSVATKASIRAAVSDASFGVFGGVRTTDLAYAAVIGVIPVVLYHFGLEVGGWHLARYWLCPLIFYKFMFPAVMSWWRSGCDILLPSVVVSAIPSYRMRRVARAIKASLKATQPAEADADAHHAHDHHHSSSSSDDEAETAAAAAAAGAAPDVEPPLWSRAWLAYCFRRIHWTHTVILFGTPAVAVYGMFTTTLIRQTAIWAFAYYFITGMGITAGYHRLFAHRAFRASLPVRILFIIAGTGALEGSIKWWCGGHRVHHRYTDTRYDPYNAKRGLLYSHIGWMLVHPRPDAYRKADISDLNADPLIRWQHKLYAVFGPFCAFLLPALIAHYFWNDFWGGLYYAGFLRLFCVHHSTFCVNSIAHHLGDQGYDDQRTPRDSLITALLTFGEGYHNFHHQFPNDYRNGIRAFDYDPTKWLIRGLYAFGLTDELKQFPHNEIAKGQIVMQHKRIEAQKQNIHWPAPVADLPVMDWQQIKAETATAASGGAGRALVVVNNLVHDVSSFTGVHPGGAALLRASIGRDATAHFTGHTGVYAHSRAAIHLLSNFRVARLPASECVAHPPPLAPPEIAKFVQAKAAAAATAASAVAAPSNAAATVQAKSAGVKAL